MSVAVNMKGRKRSDINASLRAHQLRQDEKSAKKILKDTASQIDPKLSYMNKNYFDDPNRLQEMRDKIDVISKKRQEGGGKKVYKSANVFMVGTLQIGDDSLEALGWKFKDGKKLPSDQQSERALKNVELVYDDMIKSVKSQPEIYGDIFSATLHMDEGSPHVDFMSDPLDIEKPDRLARHFLNGPKGTPKGHNLAVMQDNIMKNSRFDEKTIEKFGLVRGDGTSKRLDTANQLRAEDRRLKYREDRLNKRVENINEQLKEIKGGIKSGRQAIKSKESKLSGMEKLIREREEKARKIEEKAKKQAKEASEKLVEVSMLAKLSKGLVETYERISEKIRRGIIKPENLIDTENKTKEELKPFDDSNPQHLQSLSDALADLEEDDGLQL